MVPLAVGDCLAAGVLAARARRGLAVDALWRRPVVSTLAAVSLILSMR